MYRFRSRRRGVYFMGVLFITVLLSMFVGASLDAGIWGLKSGQNLNDMAAARRAATSGVEYALARLRDNPQWKANSANSVVVNEPGFFVVEEYGNVIGNMDNGGQASQFRIRFNYNDGGAGGDGMPNASAPMNLATDLVCLNNMVPNTISNVPLANGPGSSVPTAPTVYCTIPGHSVFLVVEGRCAKWLGAATIANPNPSPPALGSLTKVRVEAVYKLSNALVAGTPAVAASAGNFKATIATTSDKDTLKLDSASGTVAGRVRSRGSFTVQGGKAGDYNMVAGKGGGEFRSLGLASHNADPSVAQKPEGAADTLYPIPWSDVKKAAGTNILPAGTYVFWDDGSLHYFDMNVDDYYLFMANPANHANPGLPVTLPSSVVKTSSGVAAGLKAKLTITADTLVQAATNTTDLAILPQKGVSGGPGSAAAPSASTMYSQIDSGSSLFNQGSWSMPAASSFTMPSPAAYNLMDRVGQWAAGNGQGTYSAGNWNLPGGIGALNNLGTASANGNINGAGLTLVTQQISAYIAANPSDPDWASFAAAMSMPATGSQDEIPGVGSVANPRNIELNFAPGGGATSATLTAPGNVTLGTKLTGDGASITAEGNLNLVGLGVTLSALSNPTEGISLYSKKDVVISSFDKAAGTYHDVSLKGVVYAWGNFKALLGATGIAESNWGKLKLTGAMIAYGKDPSDLVSSPTAGHVEVMAKEVSLKYDSSYLLDLSNSLPANVSIGRVRWLEK